MIKLNLVEDWREAWRWSSMRLLGLSGMAELALHYFRDLPQEVTQYIDHNVLSWIATGSFVLAFLGRITQVDRNVQPPKPSE